MRVPSSVALAAVLTSLASSSCIDAYEPDVGPLQVTPCSNEDLDPENDVSYREHIVPLIFEPEPLGCFHCHTPTAPTPLGFEVSGFDITNLETLRRGGANSDGTAVIPGQPCESILYQKVRPGVPFGARMPVGGPPYLSQELLDLLHDWIAEGANDN